MPPNTPAPRRRLLFAKSLKACIEPLVRPVFKSQGPAASKMISEWPHIVGKNLAAHCLPIKLTFPQKQNVDGTLTIACEGAHALTLQHMQPVILERIASYFGYKAVARLAIEQRPMPKNPTKKTSVQHHTTVDETCLAGIEDAELKAALSGLAKTISGLTMKAHE